MATTAFPVRSPKSRAVCAVFIRGDVAMRGRLCVVKSCGVELGDGGAFVRARFSTDEPYTGLDDGEVELGAIKEDARRMGLGRGMAKQKSLALEAERLRLRPLTLCAGCLFSLFPLPLSVSGKSRRFLPNASNE